MARPRRTLVLVRRTAVLLVVALLAGCSGSAIVTGPFGESAPTPPPLRSLLWVGDASTGDLSQFQPTPWNIVGGDQPAVVSEPVRGSAHSIEVSIPGTSTSSDGICCGSRAEVVPALRDLAEGDDLYFRFSTYLADGFPLNADWQVITQFKQNFDGSPPLSLNVEQGQYRVEGGYGHPDGSRQFIVNLGEARTGTWVDWVLHVRFSTDPAVGFVEVWKDGSVAMGRYHPPGGTMYPAPDGVNASYLKTGLYRDPDIDQRGTMYLADWAVGTP